MGAHDQRQSHGYLRRRDREHEENEHHRFFGTTAAWYAQVAKLPASALDKLLKGGDKVLRLLGIGS